MNPNVAVCRIRISYSYFIGCSSSSSSSSGSAKSDGTWISTVKAVKKAYVNAKLKYKYGGSGTIKINGKKKKVKTDCSGFVSACLREYGVKVSLTSRDFLGNVKALKKAGFTKMKWPGWSKLHKGDIIARNGHVEIFSNNKGSSHRVWNFGSSKSDHVAGTTTSSYKSYSAVWRPPSGKGSGLLLSGIGSDLLVAKGSNKNTKYLSDYEYMENYVSNYEDMEDIESNEDNNEAKGSNISNSQVYNYLLNRDNYNSYNSNYKSSSTPIKYNKPASSKAYKSIDKYVKTNSIKLSNEAVNNASNK